MADSSTIPVSLKTARHACFALFDPPTGGERAAPVLICSPWGWEETASYRARRYWAKSLAAAGHPVLRFDLPAVGDSDGTAASPELLAAWREAVRVAAEWLAVAAETERVAAIGLGLGGTLALAAIDDGAPIDQIAVWAAHAKGRKYAREVRSFSILQGRDGAGADVSPLPEGWLEAGGFVLSAETLADLKSLDVTAGRPGGLRRALLFERDGIVVDADLRQWLEAASVEVEVAPGVGWSRFAGLTELPVEVVEEVTSVMERFADWLDPGLAETAAAPAERVAPDAESFVLETDSGVRETAVEIEQPRAPSSFGLAAEAPEAAASDLVLLFLNAGGIRHIGPSRVWVEAARRWAVRGVPSLRVDLDGIGEAPGEPVPIGRFPADQYDERYRAQVATVLDAVAARWPGRRIALVGLCSGGYWSFQTALDDERVGDTVLLNAGALIWRPNAKAERRASEAGRALLKPGSWRRLLTGRLDIRAALRQLRLALTVWLGGRRDRRAGGPAAADDLSALFARAAASGTRITMAFCPNEAILLDLRGRGWVERIAGLPNIDLLPLAGEDHGLGPVITQISAHEAIDRGIEGALSSPERV